MSAAMRVKNITVANALERWMATHNNLTDRSAFNPNYRGNRGWTGVGAIELKGSRWAGKAGWAAN